MNLLCDVYKTSKTADLYLYVARDEGFDRVPEALMSQFGKPELALTFELHEGRTLAREDPQRIILAIQEKGFYLQMPPSRFGQDD